MLRRWRSDCVRYECLVHGRRKTLGGKRLQRKTKFMASGAEEPIVEEAVAWSHMNGLVVGHGDGIQDVSVVHAPLALFPTPFPGEQFQLVQRSMPAFSTLVQELSEDNDYLNRTLKLAAQYDEFTGKLLTVHNETVEARERFGSAITLGLHRSDYMLDGPSGRLLQVELNTISVSFGALSTQLSKLHKHLISRYPAATSIQLDQLPAQNTLHGFADGIAAAHRAFCTMHDLDNYNVVVIFVVQPGERNAFDQRWLQTCIWERHAARVSRMTLGEIAAHGKIDESGHMSINGNTVSVFYMRAGYRPDDYPTAKEWQAREMMEKCSAVSCPSLAYQLVGAKKIQQDIAGAGQLEKFVDSDTARELRACFAGLWSLDDRSNAETQAIIEQVIAAPGDFILKPQREGGGNNIYGDEIVQKIREGTNLSSYVLMQRIKPSSAKAIMVRSGQFSEQDTLSELGVFGVYLKVQGDVVVNECVGHLVRTKESTSDEGGVAAGYAVLNTPYLT